MTTETKAACDAPEIIATVGDAQHLSCIEPKQGTGAGALVAPFRGGRGDIGAGGGAGAWVNGDGGKVRRISTKGGKRLDTTQQDRATINDDSRGVSFGWRVPFGSFLEPSTVAALAGGLPSGGFFGELQGQRDIALCTGHAAKLAASMRRDGRQMSDATKADAVGAGCLALARWRGINERHQGARIRGTAAAVAWRAIVREVSRDGLADSVSLSEFSDEALAGSALPLPGTNETREDKAARLLYERARAKRPALLARRVEHLKTTRGGRGRRADAWDKLHRAAVLLLHGESCEAAALAAGFVPSPKSKQSAGDMLRRAARRLGFRFQFDARQTNGERAARVSHAMGAGLPASYVAQLSARPSDTLPTDDRWSAPSPQRRTKAKRRAAARGERVARRARWQTKRDAKRTQRERIQRRAFKVAGLFAVGTIERSATRTGLARGVLRYRSHGRLVIG